ncbi:hypothetical protein [Falsiroseomonas selenitidurans]|uniref:Uncharacterized protein n=1 Tax=Falsiroseomonas selenitidurans TaxID=2716335 RepID=A0ABX1E2I6_9PROT|nr:hypothetical protein [Falsiroseomonas selenitidurans]NKC31301.1 hypothetical protein [Falsiroseomonas selenitidurans]
MTAVKTLGATLALAIALAPLPARALDASALWSGTLNVAEAATSAVIDPIRGAWGATTRFIWGAEDAFAREATAFAATLRSDFARFEVLAGRAGYRITTVNLQPGLIPAIELVFQPIGEISEADEAALRTELAARGGLGGALERAVLITLLDIEERVEAFRPDGFRISEVSTALVAIIPEVNVSFTRE